MNASTKIALVAAVVVVIAVTRCAWLSQPEPAAPATPAAESEKMSTVDAKTPRRHAPEDMSPAPTKSVAAGVSAQKSSSAPTAPKWIVAPQGGFPDAPAAEGEVVGKVLLFPSRTPVEGAVVSLIGGGQSTGVAPFPETTSAVTGANGVFRLGGFHPGSYTFCVDAKGRTQRIVSAKVPDGGGVGDIEVLLGSGSGIEGRVSGAYGPAVGVTVKLDRGNLSTKTDSEGVYRFDDLPAGTYWVNVVEGASGLSERRATVDVPMGASARLDFPGGASLAGRLVLDGTPLDGAIIRVQRIGEKYGNAQTRTARDGTYRIDALAPGTGRVGVQVLGDPGFSVDLGEVTIARGENRLDPRLGQGDASSEIVGRAFAKTDGSPLNSNNVQITLHEQIEKAEGVWVDGPVVSAMAFADAMGGFRIPWLRAGRYRLTALPKGRPALDRADVDFVLGAAERRTGIELALPPKPPQTNDALSASVLSGVVKDVDGRPLSHAGVRATSAADPDRARSGSTGETGRYMIERLDPGRWRVQVEVSRFDGFATEVGEVAVVPGANAFDVTLGKGDLAGELSGRVVTKSSARALSAREVRLTLNVVETDGSLRATARAWPDADGRFRFRFLRGGRFRLVAWPAAGTLKAYETDVEIAAGRTSPDMEIALDDFSTGKVVFVVRDEDGKPVGQASIVSMRGGRLEQGSIDAYSNVGVYETNFEVGRHAVTFRGADGTLVGEATIDVAEGETKKVEVVLHGKQ